jgi:hypothetical protein
MDDLRKSLTLSQPIFIVYLKMKQFHLRALAEESKAVVARCKDDNAATSARLVRAVLGHSRAVEVAVTITQCWSLLGHYNIDVTNVIGRRADLPRQTKVALADFSKINSRLKNMMDVLLDDSFKRPQLFEDCLPWSNEPQLIAAMTLAVQSRQLCEAHVRILRLLKEQNIQWRAVLDTQM